MALNNRSIVVILFISHFALALSAPTDPEVTTPVTKLDVSPTTVAPSEPTTVTLSAGSSTTSSAPTTTSIADDKKESINANSTATQFLAIGSASEHASKLNTTNFTCFGRDVGYYADVELQCRVYHFCLPGDFNGEPVFQRISYLCLNDTTFDQQALDCVNATKMIAPCQDSVSHYEASNMVLRQAIVKQGDKNSSVTSGVSTPAATNI